MRKEQVELDWRMVLGDEARALVQAVIPPDQRPTSKDLEAGIQRMQRSLSLAQGQAEGARSVASELALRLEKALADLRADQQLVFLVLAKLHREMFLVRQALALAALSTTAEADTALQKLREKTAEITALIERVIPDYERRLPSFDPLAEERAIRELLAKDADARISANRSSKAKQVDEEKEK